MPPIIPDAPWPANLALLLAGLLLVSALPAWLSYRATRGRQDEIQRAVGVVREQVQNCHGTNLRDDLDKIRDALGDVQAGQRRHDSELARVHDTQRDIQRAMAEGLERLADADAEDRRRADREHARIWHVLTPPAPLEDQ